MRYKFRGFREQGAGSREQVREKREEVKNNVYLIAMINAIYGGYMSPVLLINEFVNQANLPTHLWSKSQGKLPKAKPNLQDMRTGDKLRLYSSFGSSVPAMLNFSLKKSESLLYKGSEPI
ncbi:MAG: hypothetical protein F6J90_34135 [Moorea sp. SIOASIH]|uniref:hypothetical protein n=1 Tax=Moorena sp. SIOASIH TaxID=2607817 RepID=UPI0013BE2F94|nr:hypothetical protein [Moorena sp. SIOASIH]NEO41091.1 hypothetical protein [Moorena sp. SIOASIH]